MRLQSFSSFDYFQGFVGAVGATQEEDSCLRTIDRFSIIFGFISEGFFELSLSILSTAYYFKKTNLGSIYDPYFELNELNERYFAISWSEVVIKKKLNSWYDFMKVLRKCLEYLGLKYSLGLELDYMIHRIIILWIVSRKSFRRDSLGSLLINARLFFKCGRHTFIVEVLFDGLGDFSDTVEGGANAA